MIKFAELLTRVDMIGLLLLARCSQTSRHDVGSRLTSYCIRTKGCTAGVDFPWPTLTQTRLLRPGQ